MTRTCILPLACIATALTLSLPANAATFYFIRHAESTANTGQAATPEEVLNPPLTTLGQQQALDLAQTLADVDLTAIYVSSYQRTALTIAPTAAAHGLTPIVDADIREWSFGTSLDANVYAKLSQVMGLWAAGDTAAKMDGVPDSESLDELNARVVPAYQSIFDAYKDVDGVVAIVGHGGSIGWTMPFFAANVSTGFAFQHGLRNTAIIKVVADANGNPVVSDWDGIAFDAKGPVEAPAAVPLPASGLMLAAALGGLTARRKLRRNRRAAA